MVGRFLRKAKLGLLDHEENPNYLSNHMISVLFEAQPKKTVISLASVLVLT